MNDPTRTEAAAERSYIAFISYRHLPLDREAAIRIQKKIENYTVPKEFRDRTGGKKPGIVFRDEDELPASSSLSESITYALDHTQYLIVICTPDLPQSKWCMQEIRYFLQTHDREHVLAVLADGTPEQSFPDMLRFICDEEGRRKAEVEPLAANIAGENHSINRKTFKKEVTRLIAAMLGCPFDALWQRERRARTNRLMAAAGVIIAAMAVFIGVVLNKNAQISRQNRELQQKMSTAMVDAGRLQLQSYDRNAALNSALEALSGDDPSVYDPRVEALLSDALMAYSGGTPKCDLLFKQSTDIERIAASPDGRTAFTADSAGNIYAYNTEAAAIKWTVFLNTSETPYLYMTGDERLLCKTPETLAALSTADGSVLWTYEYDLPNSFQAISDDSSLFAVLDWDLSPEEYSKKIRNELPTAPVDMSLKVLDTSNGETIRSCSLPADPYHIYIDTYEAIYSYSGDFSDDNTHLSAALPAGTGTDTELATLFFMVDLDLSLQSDPNCIGVFGRRPEMILGSAVSDENDAVFCAFADSGQLFSCTVYTDPEKETDVSTQDYSMASPNGVSAYDYGFTADPPYLPMLTSRNLAVFFTRNAAYVVDRTQKGAKRITLDLESPIASATWLDRENEILELVTQNGRMITYALTYSADHSLSGYIGQELPVSGLSTACRVYTGTGDLWGDYLLAASADQPGYLLGLVQDTDPDYQPCPQQHITNCAFAGLTPSGDRLMAFYPDLSEYGEILIRNIIVETIDVETGAVCEHAELSLDPAFLPVRGIAKRPIAVDDSHFLLFGTIYGLDGTTVPACGNGLEPEGLSAILPDGRLLYASCGDISGTTIPPVITVDRAGGALHWWIDGEPQKNSGDIIGSIAMLYDSTDSTGDHFAVGSNGWMAGWGSCLSAEETAAAAPAITNAVLSDQTMIAAVNAVTGEKIEFRDDYIGTPVTHLVLSNKDPYLACFFENGAAVLYDLRSGTGTPLPTAYAKGEIRKLCFSDRDGFLLALTTGGRVDCFRTGTLEPVFSKANCFAASCELIDWFEAVEDPDNSRLILTAANESGKTDPMDLMHAGYWTTVVNTVSGEITARPDHICAWSVKHGRALIADGSKLGTCKVHNLKDLTEWARSSLKDPAG